MRAIILALLASAAAATPAEAGDLVLRRVMLSSAGVGYFEYEATADGNAALPLDVKLDQVDDVLKSLVVFDSAGEVGAVELPGRDDGQAAFGRVPFGPDALVSPLAYLDGLQGVEVTVDGPRPMQGRILHAETVREPGGAAGQGGRILTRVSLLTAGGLRQFVLEDSDAVQVVDPDLRGRIAQAVAASRRQSGRDSRRLTIASLGPAGPRSVRVSYVAVAPLWKASYRLVLPSDPAAPQARLQGWATLENDTGADWTGIQLAVQYGNPVTFHQAIYSSYFVQRPEVPVEVLGRLLPGVDSRARPLQARAALAPAPAPAPAAATPAPAAAQAAEVAPAGIDAAAAQEAAAQTVFTLSQPVDLPAGHSATVPILDVSLPAARIDLAKPGQEHPLAAIRLENTAGSSLPAGVLTLYDLGAAAPYAGDARLGGVPAGESRLVPFAQDLRTSIGWHDDGIVSLAALTASGGVLTIDRRRRHVTHAVISAPAQEARRVLVEVEKPEGGTVARGFAVPVEETATAWRFAADLAPGAVQELVYAIDEHETEARRCSTTATRSRRPSRCPARARRPGPRSAA